MHDRVDFPVPMNPGDARGLVALVDGHPGDCPARGMFFGPRPDCPAGHKKLICLTN